MKVTYSDTYLLPNLRITYNYLILSVGTFLYIQSRINYRDIRRVWITMIYNSIFVINFTVSPSHVYMYPRIIHTLNLSLILQNICDVRHIYTFVNFLRDASLMNNVEPKQKAVVLWSRIINLRKTIHATGRALHPFYITAPHFEQLRTLRDQKSNGYGDDPMRSCFLSASDRVDGVFWYFDSFFFNFARSII